MTTGTETANLPTVKAPLRAGGEVMAIVPQTFEETMRIARAVCIGGLAPAALIGNLTGDNAASAVAIAIMSGAELGLQPMVALRSFTVINGKPALYGDGLINVVRQSGKVAYLRTGCDIRADGQMVGWCEAKRNDTGEDKRVEFSQADAVRAGLWSDKPMITKFKQGGGSYEKANDSPWFRYPQRMLAWRAAGYCLRELFGDVLGGIRDEFEAREIADREDGMIDVTGETRQVSSRPTPPEPPADDEPETTTIISGTSTEVEKVIVADAIEGSDPAEDESPADFLTRLDGELAVAKDKETLLEIWEREDAQGKLDGSSFAADANRLYDKHDARVEKLALEAAGQGNMFGGDE